ncbi:MAG: hypothetical protein E7773_14155 [Sphingomonas sp.]|uniref:hypothetical protein n=1 Tax=Sphingomonas sp. TaxID=28214 RepID=UPI00121E838D|nr:hypothetical protein [Sphingomonas sp.]THD34799.1 MAG: hypothetical protein E7773_14155 [Sphingomonas sp.]
MRPSLLFAVAFAIVGLFAIGVPAVPAAAQTDSEGCRDGALARLPSFYINECDPAGPDHYVFAEGSASQTDIQGTKSRIAYALKDNAVTPTAASIVASYKAQLQQNGWTIVASGEPAWVTAYRGSRAGSWVQIEANGGANYQIVYVTPADKVADASAQHYALTCDGSLIGRFAQVQGLQTQLSEDAIRSGSGKRIFFPQAQKYENVTLSGGTITRPGDRTTNAGLRASAGLVQSWQQCDLVLDNEAGAALFTWQLRAPHLLSVTTAQGATTLTLDHQGYTMIMSGS